MGFSAAEQRVGNWNAQKLANDENDDDDDDDNDDDDDDEGPDLRRRRRVGNWNAQKLANTARALARQSNSA